MILRDFVRRAVAKDRIFNALFELTYDCNLDCTYCCNDKHQQGSPISLLQYESLLEEMAELGIFAVILSGGEPLSHPQFLDIGSLCRKYGFMVSIKSNGHAITQHWANAIKDRIDPFSIEISLHGANASTHDQQTRVPGSFEKLLKNIPHIRGNGITVRLNITVTSLNEKELEEMARLALSLDCIPMLSPFVSPRDTGDQSPLALSASPNAVARTYALLKELRKVQHPSDPDQDVYNPIDSSPPHIDKQCGAGSSFFSLDPFGNILPCAKWREPIGNIHASSLQEILASNNMRRVHDINRQAKAHHQSKGDEWKNVSFCIAESLLHTRQHISEYPALATQQQVFQNIPITTTTKNTA